MTKKKKNKKTESSLPFGSFLEVAEGLGSIIGKYMIQKYEVEKKVEEFKEETSERIEELQEEIVKSGYALKRSIFRAIFDAIIFTTGLASLILGFILLLKNNIPLEYVLLGYGFIVCVYVVFLLKTSPD